MFPGGRSTVMWLFVATVSTAVTAWRLAPASWRPHGTAVLVAAVTAAYLSLDASFRTGFVQWLDHDVFERLRGGVDDVATWLVAAAGSFVGLALATFLTRDEPR